MNDNYFNAEVSSRICSHMNDDHSDSCLLYVQLYCSIDDADTAEMIDIDRSAMTLSFTRNNQNENVKFNFDTPLESVEHAAKVLATMVYEVTGYPEKDTD